MEQLLDWMAANPQVWAWFTTAVRFLFPVLALLILIRTIRSLLTVPCLPEVWAYLTLPNGAQEPLTHWENILGRGGNSDVILNYPVVSRQHAALIRQADDTWTAYDLGSKGGVTVNGRPVEGSAPVQYGDVVGIGGVETVLLPLSPEEKAQRRQRRRAMRPVSPWLGLVLLTVFQALTALQLTISEGENATVMIPLTFLLLTGVMWLYFLTLRALRRVGFEMETIAFFLSTLSLAVTSSSNTPALFKQFLCVVLGLALFLVLGVFLRNLDRAKKIRWLMAAGAIGLLSLTVVLYLLGLTGTKYGAANWLTIAGISVQPSELAKICYIFAGAATLDRLFRKRNLGLFILLTGVCLACLAYMSDFGTAAIFFVTFLVIAYLRSGDWATLALICGGGVFAVLTMLSLKPYILQRFATWGHAWQNASVADPHHVGRRLRRSGGGGPRRGLAPHRGRGGHRPGVRHAVRGVGADHRPAGGAVHSHSGGVRRPGLPGRAELLLRHRRLRRHLHDGVSDLPQRVRRGGHSPPHRRHLSLRVQRRHGHDRLLGAAGLPQGHRHPSERQLCHPPALPAGGPPGGGAGPQIHRRMGGGR